MWNAMARPAVRHFAVDLVEGHNGVANMEALEFKMQRRGLLAESWSPLRPLKSFFVPLGIYTLNW